MDLQVRFQCRRYVLPDHKSGRPPELEEFQQAVALLAELAPHGPVYVHCQAGVERSPLVCMAWLIRQRRLSTIDALDYLKRVHPPTGPLPEQLATLRAWVAAGG
jgi:protein-tyrosine phosphatase